LADGARVIDEVLLGEGLRHGRDLVPTAKAACERAGWDRRRIDLVAVSIGPGSFTGIRIAVTMAKVMAHDTGAKIVAVPSMRVLAENAPPDRRRVATIIDAKRGGLFASIFERRSTGDAARAPRPLLDEFNEIFGPALIEPEVLARHLESPALILGRGIVKGGEALKAFDFAPENLWDPRPAVVARLGAELAARGEFVDPMHLAPIYIRPPEAEELWQRRQRLGT
ncbi:MAG: tRNA (adenosine(37)-N6)-threonylcarbamoyltransferase complex dimerization subunit type 1 TsaB, partial [Planctomycetota bacterium]|nr:tRNA (adenosine(37)-N6)-threonylcarbamoyltransferase complex dimerization subunit type 1 TsaB [Planctomycetota bacterium]